MRSLVLLAYAFLGLAALIFVPSTVSGQAQSEIIPFEDYWGLPLCGGEEIIFSGSWHYTVTETVDENGGLHTIYHMNLVNTRAVGIESGKMYRMTESNTWMLNTNGGSVVSQGTINGTLVGSGPNSNTLFHLTFVFIVDENGTIKVEIQDIRTSCVS